MSRTTVRWMKYVVAVLLGNGLYFSLSRYLPPTARQAAYGFNVGTLVDLWFCVAVYGLLELATLLGQRNRKGPR